MHVPLTDQLERSLTRSWPTERRHASIWSACRPIARSWTLARAAVNSSQGVSGSMCAGWTSPICVMRGATRW